MLTPADADRLVKLWACWESNHAGERAERRLEGAQLIRASGETWATVICPGRAGAGSPGLATPGSFLPGPPAQAQRPGARLRRDVVAIPQATDR